MEVDSKLDFAKTEKADGNAQFNAELLDVLCLNAARTHLKLCNADKARDRVEQVLHRNPRSVKALFLKGKALVAQQHFDEAEQLFTILLGEEDGSIKDDVLRELKVIKAKQAVYLRATEEMCRKMF